MKTIITFFMLLFIFGCACNKSMPLFSANGSSAVINEQLYSDAKAKSTVYAISNAAINGDNLELKVGLTGYASNWEQRIKNLIASGAVMESMPPQMNLRLYISPANGDPVSSYYGSYDLSFDLKPLRQKGYDKIALNLAGWKGSLIYEY